MNCDQSIVTHKYERAVLLRKKKKKSIVFVKNIVVYNLMNFIGHFSVLQNFAIGRGAWPPQIAACNYICVIVIISDVYT